MDSLTVKTLIGSRCLSSSPFKLTSELPSLDGGDGFGVPGQTQRLDKNDNGNGHNSPLRIENAVRLSLLLTKAFARCYDLCGCASLTLDDFTVTLQPMDSPRTEEEERRPPITVSTVDGFDGAAAAAAASGDGDGRGWILLDVAVRYLDARLPLPNVTPSSLVLVRSVGELLLALFFSDPNVVPVAGAEGGVDVAGADTSEGQAPKMRMRTSTFQKLIAAGECPIAVCRLLSDLMDGVTPSLSDVVGELEQMVSLPQLFLHDPGSEFYARKLQFGQSYYGRREELERLLEVTTVPKDENEDRLEVIFVSGMAGSGKSHLVSAVGSFVSSFGYVVLRAKFKRGMEYKSREIMSSLMDELVTEIVEMKERGNVADVSYSLGVARAISQGLDADTLSALVAFVPSIQSLIPEVTKNKDLGSNQYALVFLMSTLLCALLSQERKIFIALDDLQWADHTTLGLINEVLVSICQCPKERQHLVFVGMYRDEEISSDLTSFTSSFAKVQDGNSANLTDVKLSALSLDDVTEMIASELRIPHRIVSELADVVHKRTHGHAIFVVQLLNSLISDSTIAYSPMLHRFHWDQDKVCALFTADSVASLIVSNLTTLPEGELRCLRLISCFGIQVDYNLLELLEADLGPHGGFQPCLRNLVDQGIVKIDASMIAFTHDLIQEQVYEGIPAKERQQLHFDVGLLLGSKTSLDFGCENKPIDAAINQLQLNSVADKGEAASPLLSFATSQINSAGPDFFPDREQKSRFSRWNLRAGRDATAHSLFLAALYYYKNGIAFLGDELVWLEDTYELCLKLYEGAAFSSSALGESKLVLMYTNDIIKNAKFEDSLGAEYLLIVHLSTTEQCKEAISRGISVLRQLKFGIPEIPSPVLVMQLLEQTEREALLYSSSQLAGYKRNIDSKTRNISKLVDAIAAACYQTASPFLPLLACATVRHSLQNGICEESASAFVIFAYFQIFLRQSFESGFRWGNFAKHMLDKASAESLLTVRARFLLSAFVMCWYVPLQESLNSIQEAVDMSLKLGDTEGQYRSQGMYFEFLFFRGEKLSILSHAIDRKLQAMARFKMVAAKFSTLDKEMINSLTGDESSDPYAIFDGEICNQQSLLADAESKMQFQTQEAVHLRNFYVLFWFGDYDEAAEASDVALSFPSAKMPKIHLPFHKFYRGIVAFHLFREGKGEKWLKEGKEIHDQMEIWLKNSKPIFENKFILLKAEYSAALCNAAAAKLSYQQSIQVARDNGYIHEQALAYECMGRYLMSIVEVNEAKSCFLNAHNCYVQWGAMAKADKLLADWNLDSSTASIRNPTMKHHRNE